MDANILFFALAAAALFVVISPILLVILALADPREWADARQNILPALIAIGVCVLFFIVYALTESFILSGGASALFLVAYNYFDADKVFGWMFRGQHYGNRAIKRNQKEAAKEFGRLMKQQAFDDARMATLFQNMSETRQRIWRVKYQERVKQAQRLRALIDEQRKAIQSDTQLGKDVEQREVLRAIAQEVRRR